MKAAYGPAADRTLTTEEFVDELCEFILAQRSRELALSRHLLRWKREG